MRRLLQGDVGSGKTVVALYCLVRAAEAGFQGALMAPTETLAIQHAETAARLAGALGRRRAADRGARRQGAAGRAREDRRAARPAS